MASTVTGGAFSFSTFSVGGMWQWDVRANNTQGLGQTYQIANINTPYGPLNAADIPIPGDVLSSMCDSLNQLQQQLGPLIVLNSGTQTQYVLTVTEGDPSVFVGDVKYFNAGAFGSFMTATTISDVPWLVPNPSQTIGIGKNQTGQVSIWAVPSLLLATDGPYQGSIILQDNRAPSTVIPVSVIVNVLPRAVLSVSTSSIFFSYSLSAGFQGGAQQFSVSNTGPTGSMLSYTVSKIINGSPWLRFSPACNDGIIPGVSDIVTVSLTANLPQSTGTYTETLAVASPNALGSPTVVTITLSVSP